MQDVAQNQLSQAITYLAITISYNFDRGFIINRHTIFIDAINEWAIVFGHEWQHTKSVTFS